MRESATFSAMTPFLQTQRPILSCKHFIRDVEPILDMLVVTGMKHVRAYSSSKSSLPFSFACLCTCTPKTLTSARPPAYQTWIFGHQAHKTQRPRHKTQPLKCAEIHNSYIVAGPVPNHRSHQGRSYFLCSYYTQEFRLSRFGTVELHSDCVAVNPQMQWM